jgi:hypothetical protein
LPAVLLESLCSAQEADHGVLPFSALLRRALGSFASCVYPQGKMLSQQRAAGTYDDTGQRQYRRTHRGQLIPTMMQAAARYR